MKAQERERARALRQQGLSLKDIVAKLGVSKASVSVWVRDIALTEAQIGVLKGRRPSAEKCRNTRLRQRAERIAAYIREADQEYERLRHDVDFMFGLALYIGEGSKTQEGLLIISNCDCRVIRKAIAFFEKLGVSRDRMRCGIHLHPGLPEDEVLAYWCAKTGFPEHQFQKTVRAVSSASSGKGVGKQPYGTCRVVVGSRRLYHKIMRWMRLVLGE
jgi:hypothetical protein